MRSATGACVNWSKNTGIRTAFHTRMPRTTCNTRDTSDALVGRRQRRLPVPCVDSLRNVFTSHSALRPRQHLSWSTPWGCWVARIGQYYPTILLHDITHRIPDTADTRDSDLHRISGTKRANTRRSPCSNEIPGLQRHDVRDERKKHGDLEDHFGARRGLSHFVIHCGDELQRIQVDVSFVNVADRAERVESLRPGPLTVLPLQVPRRHIVDSHDTCNP